MADHLREYATFKAMGYGPRFFLGIVVEEALVLGVLGFLPGFAVGTAILMLMGKVTTLPLAMTSSMAIMVFGGTVVFSVPLGRHRHAAACGGRSGRPVLRSAWTWMRLDRRDRG